MHNTSTTPRFRSTYLLVNIAVLSLLSLVLMFVSIRLPMFPTFLALDVSDVPALVGTVAFGPLAGVMIVLIKNLLHFVLNTSTAGVGELANFVIGVALVVPIGAIYRAKRDLGGYFVGSLIGLISMVVVACLFNYFVLIPIFAHMFLPLDAIIGAANVVNSSVVDLPTLIIFAIAPFNVLKGAVVILFGYIIMFRFKLLQHIKLREN